MQPPGTDTEQTTAGGFGEVSLDQGSGRQTTTAPHKRSSSENNDSLDISVIAEQ